MLSAYVDGQVSESEASRIEQHLGGCEEYRLELDSLRATVALLRDLPQLEVPRSFTLAEAPYSVRYTRPVVWGAGLATSLAALLLVALLMVDVLDIVSQTAVVDETAAWGVLTQAAVAATEAGGPAIPAELPPPTADEEAPASPVQPAAAVPAPAVVAAPAPEAAMAAPAPQPPEIAPEAEMDTAVALEAPAEVAAVEEGVVERAEPVEEAPALTTATASIQGEDGLNPNPPKDTDGRREESGRGVRELQGK